MTEQKPDTISLIDQILGLLFAQLSTHEEFDADTIEDLNRMAMHHELSKPSLVITAVKANPGGDHETH